MSGRVWTDIEIATEWDCDVRLVQKMIRDGRLRGFHAGRALRITDSAKEEFEQGDDAKRIVA